MIRLIDILSEIKVIGHRILNVKDIRGNCYILSNENPGLILSNNTHRIEKVKKIWRIPFYNMGEVPNEYYAAPRIENYNNIKKFLQKKKNSFKEEIKSTNYRRAGLVITKYFLIDPKYIVVSEDNDYRFNNLDEIKIIPKITPEMVIELYNQIFSGIEDLWDDTLDTQNKIVDLYSRLDEICEKYGIFNTIDGFDEEHESIVQNLDQPRLNSFYNELLQFQNNL